MLDFAILGFLRYQPQTGYDLHQAMGSSTGFFWYAQLSQVYTTLKRLEGKGWVTSHIEPQQDRPDRRVYTVTPDGDAALDDWLGTPLTELEPRKELLLLRLFFSGRLDPATTLASLQVLRSLHARQQALYAGPIRDRLAVCFADPDPVARREAICWDATRDFGERFERMYVEWLDDTIARLSHPEEVSGPGIVPGR